MYVFGNLKNGYTQYPDDYAKEIFQKFHTIATANSQIIIHRDNSLMYYGYIRKLDEASQYIGFCVLLNGVMFSQIKKLFSVFEGAVAELVAEGEILAFNDSGGITSHLGRLSEGRREIERIAAIIGNEIAELANNTRKLPPVSFGIANDACMNFSVSDKNGDIVNASAKYGYICISKESEYDTARMNSFKSILGRLSDENRLLKSQNAELQEHNKKILNQKKQYRYVLVLVLILLGLGTGLFFLNDNLKNAKEDLSQAHQTISSKDQTINNKEKTIAEVKNTVKALEADLNREKEMRVKVENEFSAFKQKLADVQPFIVKETSFNFSTGWLSFDYVGFKDETITLNAKAISGSESISTSTSMSVEKGNNSFSVYISSSLNRSKWYSFELLAGNKIVGGGRH